MPKFLILALALCVAIMLGGCSRNESPTSEGPTGNSSSMPLQLVGTWDVYSATVAGVDTPFIVVLHRKTTAVDEEMIIDANGNYSASDFDLNGELVYTETGTLGANGQNFTLTVKAADAQPLNPSEQKSGQWEASGDNLTLVINNGGKIVVIRYVRSSSAGAWDY